MTERKFKTRNSIYVHPCLQTHPICQQTLRSCRPTIEHRPYVFLGIFAALHLGMGIFAICSNRIVKQYKVRYDDLCNLSSEHPSGTTIIHFDNEALKDTIYLYYELHDYYQTYFRNWLTRYEHSQLEELPRVCQKYQDPQDAPLIPCGVLFTNFFTDYYAPLNANFTERGIAWDHDYDDIFDTDGITNHTTSNSSLFPRDSLNEHFIVWMRLSGHSTFRKLFAKANDGVPPNVTVKVYCNYSYNIYHGERYLVLLRPGPLGGKTWVLAMFNFIICGASAFFIIVYLIINLFRSKKEQKQNLETPPVHHSILAQNDNPHESHFLMSGIDSNNPMLTHNQ